MQLIKNGSPVPTYFDLMGDKENDMTAGLAFVLSKSPSFLRRVMRELFGSFRGNLQNVRVKIQTNRGEGGITDVELVLDGEYCAIIEAKRDQTIPSRSQLAKYAPHARKSKAKHQVLVSLSNASQMLAKSKLPKSGNVKGVPVIHRSWRRIKELTDASVKDESNSNKRLLREFSKYLEGILGMENIYSNMVYVVSLGRGNPDGWDISWIDIVEKRKRYFYTTGTNWPDPPNYMAFRYHSKLQSIYHVKSHDVITNPQSIFKEAPEYDLDTPWYCLKLGKRIDVPGDIKCGPRIRYSARCWCMLDTLLTCKTLSDALTQTEKRIKANK